MRKTPSQLGCGGVFFCDFYCVRVRGFGAESPACGFGEVLQIPRRNGFDGEWFARIIALYLIVTNSSAPVGWMATVLSKSALVAPILMATAKP